MKIRMNLLKSRTSSKTNPKRSWHIPHLGYMLEDFTKCLRTKFDKRLRYAHIRLLGILDVAGEAMSLFFRSLRHYLLLPTQAIGWLWSKRRIRRTLASTPIPVPIPVTPPKAPRPAATATPRVVKTSGKKQPARKQGPKKKSAQPTTPPPTAPAAIPTAQAAWKIKTGHVTFGVVLGVAMVGLTLYAFWPISGLMLYLVLLAGAGFLAYKQAGGKGLGWTAAGGLVLLLMILSYNHFGNGSEQTHQTASAQASSGPVATAPANRPIISMPAREVIFVPAEATPKVVTATKEKCSPVYRFPGGHTLSWNALKSTSRYKMKTQSREYTFTPEKSDQLEQGEVIIEACFMAIGDTSEEIYLALNR